MSNSIHLNLVKMPHLIQCCVQFNLYAMSNSNKPAAPWWIVQFSAPDIIKLCCFWAIHAYCYMVCSISRVLFGFYFSFTFPCRINTGFPRTVVVSRMGPGPRAFFKGPRPLTQKMFFLPHPTPTPTRHCPNNYFKIS